MDKEQEKDIVVDKQYLNPDQLISYCSKEKYTIKIVSSDVPFNNLLVLKDISIKTKGDDEDKIFAESHFLHKNVRRGNTVLEVLNKDKQVEERYIARKGLKKFFDVYLEYLDLDEVEKVSTWVNKNKHFGKLKALTIDPVQEVFSRKEAFDVHIYKLGKANGENAQISYIKKFDAWVVSSKNVSMLIQSNKNVQIPDEQRYGFTRLISQVWIEFVRRLEEQNPQLLIELKEYLDGRTFVGEYCGNQDYQHLVKYDKIDLHFYAVVENNSRETCIPTDIAYQIFEKFGLTKVQVSKLTAHSWKEFNDIVFKLYKEVGSSPIEQDGEGAVLYFISENRQTQEQQVISLCKLKTLDYRIFRKLREKLKNCLVDKKGSGSKWFKKFEKEVLELCEFCEPAHELDYYNTIAKTAFDFIESSLSAKHRNMVASRYITFLDMIKKSIDEKVEINLKFLKEYFESVPMQEGEKNIGSVLNNTRIIIVSPPFYLTEKFQKDICEALHITKIGNSWREGHSNVDLIAVDNIHIPPRITAQRLNKFNIFVFIGFNEKRMVYLKNQIEVLKIKAESQEELSYTKANSLKNIFSTNAQKLKEIKQNSKTFLPNNSLFLDDIYQYSDDNLSIVNEEESNQKLLQIITQAYQKKVDEMMNAKLKKFEVSDDLQKNDSQEEENQEDEEEKKEESDDQQNKEKDSQKKQKQAKKTTDTKQNSTKKNVLIIVPITIPATGKTTFFNEIIQYFEKENKDIKIHYQSSDIIRKQIMDEIQQGNPNQNYTQDELFQKSSKKATSRFQSAAVDLIDQIQYEEAQNHIVIFDKNHPPSAIQSTIPFIQETMPKNVNYKIIALTPKVLQTHSTGNSDYPFSVTYLLNCIDRSVNRDTHETLVGDTSKLAGVVFMFFNLYRNIKFSAGQLQKMGFQKQIQITFHQEKNDSDSKINNKLLKKVDQVLMQIRPQDDFEQSPIIQEFLEVYYSTQLQFEKVEFDEQKTEFINQIEEIFKSFK
ncbi:hypothetical protein TTHERM_00052480 (macronuclear) [Tetrahymena thermophila SB210]|uniref:Uncharacterized protein n=1 Tax=Tetrahymena thermophila (strain SB210) TaxID=312017 RepID=Q23CU2_TETTS|nr:hypothetical protein TTHERM_00052480 [Tetrahymena thermophila SB210]EAR94538.1 hypothetical protein TTHERM_00052480 [Tetrahymena thermophila SB210]|eukprot:XP_001014944.1 hypothetical protein TTHERM_00052480 [Tetrahymena thermophila SB210]